MVSKTVWKKSPRKRMVKKTATLKQLKNVKRQPNKKTKVNKKPKKEEY